MLLLTVAPLVIGAVVVGGGIAFVSWYFSEHRRTTRSIRRAKRVRVSDAKDGDVVRIVGRLRTRATVTGPLSGRACAHYDLQVEVFVATSKSASWEPLFRDVTTVDFDVEDESGRALVDASAFKGAVVLDHKQDAGAFNDATPELEAILAKHGETSASMGGLDRAIRYREGVLEAHETVAVRGRARWEDDLEAGSARKMRLVIEAHGDAVYGSDDPEALG